MLRVSKPNWCGTPASLPFRDISWLMADSFPIRQVYALLRVCTERSCDCWPIRLFAAGAASNHTISLSLQNDDIKLARPGKPHRETTRSTVSAGLQQAETSHGRRSSAGREVP